MARRDRGRGAQVCGSAISPGSTRYLAELDARLPDDGSVRLAFACTELDAGDAVRERGLSWRLGELIGQVLASSIERPLARMEVASIHVRIRTRGAERDACNALIGLLAAILLSLSRASAADIAAVVHQADRRRVCGAEVRVAQSLDAEA